MQDQPLIRPVTELATMFGCTPEQVRAQFLRNAADYDKLAAKAEAKGAKVRGYTAAQLRDMAETARKRAGA